MENWFNTPPPHPLDWDHRHNRSSVLKLLPPGVLREWPKRVSAWSGENRAALHSCCFDVRPHKEMSLSLFTQDWNCSITRSNTEINPHWATRWALVQVSGDHRLDKNSSYSKERRNSSPTAKRVSNEDRATNSSWSYVPTTNNGTHWVTVTQYRDANIRRSLDVTLQLFAPRLHNKLHKLCKAADQQAALQHHSQRGLI